MGNVPLDCFRSAMASGKSKSEIVAAMKSHGLSIIDAIKASRELFNLNLGDAKELVASHHAYVDSARASIPLQEEAIRSLQDVAASQSNESRQSK